MIALSRCIGQLRLKSFVVGGIAPFIALSMSKSSDDCGTSLSRGGGYWMEVILVKPR